MKKGLYALMDVWRYRRGTTGARLVAEFAGLRGVTLSRLIAGTGMTEADLHDPRAEILAAQELALIKNYLGSNEDSVTQGFAVGRMYHFTAFGLWGLGLMSCETVADALAMALRFLPMTYVFSDIVLGVRDGTARLTFAESDAPDALSGFLVERDMASAALLLDELCGGRLAVTRVSRSGAPYGNSGRARVAGRAVEWFQERNSIAFATESLSMRLPQADANSAAMCEQMCEMLLERRLIRNAIAENVRSILDFATGARPDLPAIARRFDMSERTLKRRLAGEGTSFSALLDESRKAQATALLAERGMALTDIATHLGFSDLSSFSQAFKRWFGSSPRHYRAGQSG